MLRATPRFRQATCSSGWVLRGLELALALLLVTSCATEPNGTEPNGTEPDGREYDLVPGVLDTGGYYNDEPSVHLWSEGVVGQRLPAIVTTYGGGCHRKGPTEVTVEGLLAVVEPYDSLCVSCQVCTRELRSFERTIWLMFGNSGTATVRFVGKLVPGDTLGVIEHTAVIH